MAPFSKKKAFRVMIIGLLLFNLLFFNLLHFNLINRNLVDHPQIHALNTAPYTFLALGDSYTIGESVSVEDRWPNQLYRRTQEEKFALSYPKIIAQTGWTTLDLMNAIATTTLQSPYDWVSLLIGVNDQFRGRRIEDYEHTFQSILETAINLTGGDPHRVIVLSIPDYSVTPFAQNWNRAQITQEIRTFNQVNYNYSSRYHTQYVNITSISQQAATNLTLLADDGLHPSGEMYKLWVDQISPVVSDPQLHLDTSTGSSSNSTIGNTSISDQKTNLRSTIYSFPFGLLFGGLVVGIIYLLSQKKIS